MVVGKAEKASWAKRCVAVSSPGGTCSIVDEYYKVSQDNCPEGERCSLSRSDLDMGKFNSNCVPEAAKGAAGQYCGADAECESTAYCSTTELTCKPYRENGELCADDIDCYSQVCKEGVCQFLSARCE